MFSQLSWIAKGLLSVERAEAALGSSWLVPGAEDVVIQNCKHFQCFDTNMFLFPVVTLNNVAACDRGLNGTIVADNSVDVISEKCEIRHGEISIARDVRHEK